MGRPKKEKQDDTTELEMKIAKAIGEEVLDGLRGLDRDGLKEKLATLAQHEQETLQHQKQNKDLATAKDEVKNLNAPYKETLNGIGLQRQFIASMLDDMSGKANPTSAVDTVMEQ